MNELTILALKVCRLIYSCLSTSKTTILSECEQDPDTAAEIMYQLLISDQPCIVARFGANEIKCLCNYIGVKKHQNKYFDYIKGQTQTWWWDNAVINNMHQGAGFFPNKIEKIEQFCELMLNDISEIDVLGSWLPDEKLFEQDLTNCKKINFELLNPFFSKTPWTNALRGKNVLVVHPFARTIEQQYKKRELLFNDDLLPQFELKTIKAVQSIAGNTTEFADWFEALESMKTEINKHDYDICLIGCGAYGFPLAAHVKRMGKKAVHLGGNLQLLFGIRGKRWENPNYNDKYNYSHLMNEHWVKPSIDERPNEASKVENACYW